MKRINVIINSFIVTRKKIYILLSLIFSSFIFLFPFFITTRNDSLLSIISFSFAGIGALASFFTLLIAINLYQRFGLESKFIEKKADTVLALAECLKGKMIKATHNEGKYLLRPEIIDIKEQINYFPELKDLYQKTVTFKSTKDYNESMKPILKFLFDPWLPNEIKEKLEFLELKWYSEDDSKLVLDDFKKYSEFDFGTDNIREPILPGPEITVEQFILKYSDLVSSINNWLNRHCDIDIDLKLKQPRYYSESV